MRSAVALLLLSSCLPTHTTHPTEPDYLTRALSSARIALVPFCETCDVSMRPDDSTPYAKVHMTIIGHTIRYNPSGMQLIETRFGAPATAALFSHELGHVIQFEREGMYPDSWAAELYADRWAGCAMARLGYAVDTADGMMNTLSPAATVTHPQADDRIEAVHAGYASCL